MDRGRWIENWNHTSHILAILANIHRNADEHPEPFTPNHFHPHYADMVADADDVDPVALLESNGF